MRLVVVLVCMLALSGCVSKDGGSSDPVEPDEAPAEAPVSETPDEPKQTGSEPSGAPAKAASEAPAPPLVEFTGCNGPSSVFYMDPDVAKEIVQAPFEAAADGRPGTAEIGNLAAIWHRTCDVYIEGESLGEVNVALGLISVWVPETMQGEGGALGNYLHRLHTDHPALNAFLSDHGMPTEEATFSEGSQWLVGWSGAFDTSMAGDRIIGVTADNPLVGAAAGYSAVFHREGSDITRWSFQSEGLDGDVAETAIQLDDAWGQPVAVNLYFSSYAYNEAWANPEFTLFDPDGNMRPYGPSDT